MCSQVSGGGVGGQRVRHGPALASQMLHGVGQVGRVPEHDGRDHQVQTGRPELLRILAAVGFDALTQGVIAL